MYRLYSSFFQLNYEALMSLFFSFYARHGCPVIIWFGYDTRKRREKKTNLVFFISSFFLFVSSLLTDTYFVFSTQ
jgi:hypothetical protein